MSTATDNYYYCVFISLLSQPNETGDPESAQPFSSNYLVEMSALASSGQDAIGTEMKSFAEHLKPYPAYFIALYVMIHFDCFGQSFWYVFLRLWIYSSCVAKSPYLVFVHKVYNLLRNYDVDWVDLPSSLHMEYP